ncbi:hypothetical protein GCM10023148_19080 [Actinokineospora soli]
MSRTWLTAFRGAAIAAVAFGSLMHPTAAVAEAGPDNVTGAWGCEWPYACLYNSAGTKVSQYKAVTSGWQSFSRTDVYYGVNTRNDDVVYIRFTNGRVACLPAGDAWSVYYLRSIGVPNGIRIDSSPICFP